MNARELAVELLGLDRRERERLLAELPESRRAEMIALMREAEDAAEHATACATEDAAIRGLQHAAARAAGHAAEHTAAHAARRGAHTPAALFEAHFQDAERAQRRDASFDHLNDGQLRLLLSAEQSSVQQRVISALRSGAIESWPPAVRRVVLTSLRSHQQSSRVPLPETARAKPRWQWPWRRKRA